MNKHQRYRIKHAGRIKAIAALWNARNQHKRKAHSTLNRAVKNGHIKRPKLCQMCSKAGRIIGHHPDYSRPLAVLWVCYSCHSKIHGVCVGVPRNAARGEDHPSSKLKAKQVLDIYRRVQSGESRRALGREFGVSEKLVRLIMRGEVWNTATLALQPEK